MGAEEVDAGQVGRAAAALRKWEGRRGAEGGGPESLFGEDGMVYLQVALKRVPQARKDMPVRIEVPHALYEFEGAEVCLLVKDKKGEGHKAAKERLRQEEATGLAKVLGVSKLRAKYESHEAKRQLCHAYDLFLADDRIIPVLPKLLGKSFYKKKKQPIPVRLRGKDWKAQIEKARRATYTVLGGGTCVNIRVARSAFEDAEVVENVMAAVGALPEVLPGKWRSIQALYLKTAESVALPIYQTLPEVAGRSGKGGGEAPPDAGAGKKAGRGGAAGTGGRAGAGAGRKAAAPSGKAGAAKKGAAKGGKVPAKKKK